MIKFIKFTIVWVSCNLSIPFWMVGHVHLTLNIYQDMIEILASMGMNIVVAIGFWINWKESKLEIPQNKPVHFPIGTEIEFIQYGDKETTVVSHNGTRIKLKK